MTWSWPTFFITLPIGAVVGLIGMVFYFLWLSRTGERKSDN